MSWGGGERLGREREGGDRDNANLSHCQNQTDSAL